MSQTEVTPIHFLQTLQGDYAQKFLFSDGHTYVVKFFKVKNYRKREIVNEWIAGKLARLLDLPALPMKIVNIPEKSLADIPPFRSAAYQPGKHLAAPFLADVKSYAEMNEPPSKDTLINLTDLAGMLVFDQWVNNSDRSRTNILFEEKEKGSYFFWMIDHGRCFPGMYDWNEHTLSQKPVYRVDMPVYKWASSLLTNSHALYEFCEKIICLRKEDLQGILTEIPSEWNVTEQEKEKLLSFLKREQLRDLPQLIIDANSDYFST